MNRTYRIIGTLLLLFGLEAYLGGNPPPCSAEAYAPVVYPVNGQTPHWIGRLLSNGQTHYLVADQGEVGFLLYGIRMPLPEGSFQAVFRLRADQPTPQVVAAIDVHAVDPSKQMALFLTSPTNLTLASSSVRGTDFENPGQFRDISLRFSTRGLAGSVLYELRVQSSGQTGIWLQQTELRRIE